MTLLEVSDLRTHIRGKRSTVKAVDGVSFTVGAGETVGLVGESGCGKSMTGMSIMRLLPPGGQIAGGSITLDGAELTTMSAQQMRHVRGNDVAVVFQDPMTSLNPTMTIGEQIAGPVRVHRGASKQEAMDRAAEVLELVGMPEPSERLRTFPHQLSGGLRQRVMLAMALSCEPKLLIADEPTTALDVTIQSQILTLLDDLKARLDMGILLITHDMGVIAGRADRVMVMYAGRVVESAPTPSLFTGMRHPYTEALIESIPDLEVDRSHVLYTIPGLPPDLSHPPANCRFAPRCRYAQERCRREDPVLRGEDPVHPYACFFPVDGPPAKPDERELGEPASPGPARAPEQVGEAVDEQVIEAEAERSEVQAVVAAAHAGSDDAPDGDRARPLLALHHVVKEFPITRGVLQRQVGSIKAVSDVTLEIGRGETFGLVGESGCGKTTLGRLIVGLDTVDSGSVRFDGEEVSTLRGAARRRTRQAVQFMFQDPYTSLDPRMRISSTLREPLQAQHLGNRSAQQARIEELLGEVGLAAGSTELYPHEFSGGQRQRIGFARALTTEPRLIVADEPVSALDVSIQSQVLNLMKRLQLERDLTYLIISHDLSVVRYLADRIGVMYLGKLVEVGPGAEIYERPAHPYTAALLEAIPRPDPARERSKRTAAMDGELPSAASPPSGCRFRTRCPRAQGICAEVEPPPRPFGTAGHLAACHFPLQEPLEPTGELAAPGTPPATPSD